MQVTEQKANELVRQFLEMLEKGEFPEAVARSVIHANKHDIPSSRWSLGNRLIMLLNGTTDARGYRQWQEVGRHVKKGARAFYILAPRTVRIKEKIQQQNPETGEIEEVEVERVQLVGFLGVPVFRFEDTEGEPLQLPDYKPPVLPPLAPLAQQYGITVEYGPFTSHIYGYYSPSENKIMLMSHDVDVFFHELAHAVHYQVDPGARSEEKGRKEVIAETVAATLCILYGYKGYLKDAAKYIEAYTTTKTKMAALKAIMKDIGIIEEVITKILTDAEKLAKNNAA